MKWIQGYVVTNRDKVNKWIRRYVVTEYPRIQLSLGVALKLQGILLGGAGGIGVLPYMGYIGMCRCEGYGFQAVYSGIGSINQRVWV